MTSVVPRSLEGSMISAQSFRSDGPLDAIDLCGLAKSPRPQSLMTAKVFTDQGVDSVEVVPKT
eukprot:gene2326-13222_t